MVSVPGDNPHCRVTVLPSIVWFTPLKLCLDNLRKKIVAKDKLPVSLVWRLPPDWATVFPTIHFEVSSRRWKKYEGWQTPEHFNDFYGRYNPPPRSANELSPFKQYAKNFDGPEWSFPGELDEHLLDPDSLHRFSKFELRGLSEQEMKNLHSAHHEEQIEPGFRPQ